MIDLPLGPQSSRKCHWWMKIDHEKGKTAITHYKVLKRFDGKSYLELKPHTGRTHQLRVHCQAMGCPIVGDRIYGHPVEPSSPVVPLHLHGYSVKIPLYPHKKPLYVTAPLPDYLAL